MKTYTYTVSDPGTDTMTVVESCGANGTRTDTAADNSFDCTFPDGPADTTIKVTADDGDPTDNIGFDEEAEIAGFGEVSLQIGRAHV